MPGDDLACIDADADGKSQIWHVRHIHPTKFLLHLYGTNDGSKGAILLGDGNSENDHDSIALKLGQHAFVFERNIDHRRKITVQNADGFNRIDFAAYRAEAPNIREQDGGIASLTFQAERFRLR